MHSVMLPLFAAAGLASLAQAYTQPKGDPTWGPLLEPSLSESITQGQDFTITWDPETHATDGVTVSLVLCQGPSTNCVPADTAIASGLPASQKSFDWSVPCGLAVGTQNTDSGYGMLIIVDGTGEYQYSTQFSCLAGKTCSSSSSGSSTTNSTSGSTTITSSHGSATTLLPPTQQTTASSGFTNGTTTASGSSSPVTLTWTSGSSTWTTVDYSTLPGTTVLTATASGSAVATASGATTVVVSASSTGSSTASGATFTGAAARFGAGTGATGLVALVGVVGLFAL